MKHGDTVIVANGELVWNQRLTAICRSARLLLATDGGANHLAKIGLRPAAVIGDLDSISDSVRNWLGEERIIKRPDQNRTDLDKAISYAFDETATTAIVVLGALGGRCDHQAGNLALLAALARGRQLVFMNRSESVFAVTGSCVLEAERGETWSFWTLDSGVSVSLAGLRWPVRDARLHLKPSISNIAEGSEIEVEARGGAIIVCRHEKTRHAPG